MPRTLFLATILGIAVATTARGDLVDQSYIPITGQGFNTSANVNLPIGQEFTPTLNALDFVDLFIGDAGSDPGPGANLRLNIRSGSITGTILGTSQTSFVADNTNLGVGLYANFIVTRFFFSSPVALTPGAVQVIEFVQLPPISPPNFNFLAYGGPANASTYAGGRGIVTGTPQPNYDFAFREGLITTAIPEPSTVALALTGLVMVLGRVAVARRRR